jgi:hypothetical protein
MRKWPAVAMLNVVLACYVAIAAARVVRNTAAFNGGKDFYPYWYASFSLRERSDPYAAYLQGGTPATAPARLTALPSSPAVTAPLLPVALPFSFLPWAAAKWAWLIVAVTAIAFTPAIAFRAAERFGHAVGSLRLTIHLLFFSLLATRLAVGNGQLVCPVIFLLMLALKITSPWLAGLVLGIALSKYSVAIPVAIVFLFRRDWIALAVAALVQFAGAVALSLWTGSTLLSILTEYLAIARMHAPQAGYQFQSPVVDAVIAAALLAIAWWRFARRRYQVLAFLCAGSLLVVYHRVYDGVLLLPAIIALAPLKRRPMWTTIGLAIALSVLMLPGTIIDSQRWVDLSGDAQRYAVLLLLGILTFEVMRDDEPAQESILGTAGSTPEV